MRHRISNFCGAPRWGCAIEFFCAHLHVGPPCAGLSLPKFASHRRSPTRHRRPCPLALSLRHRHRRSTATSTGGAARGGVAGARRAPGGGGPRLPRPRSTWALEERAAVLPGDGGGAAEEVRAGQGQSGVHQAEGDSSGEVTSRSFAALNC